MSYRLQSACFAWGNSQIGSAADTRYLSPWWENNLPAVLANKSIVVPRRGVLQHLFVRHNSVSGNGNSVVYTVLINGIASALTVTLPTGAIGTGSDTTNSAVVAQGDRLTLRAVKSLALGSSMVDVTVSLELV